MKRIGLFFGGLGNEAAVSVVSAQNVFANIDHDKYQVFLFYWHPDGFYSVNSFEEIDEPSTLVREDDFKNLFDVALLMTHGRYGEDGVLQAVFERQKIAYCGCRVLSSALCMDKAVCKRYLANENIPQVRYSSLDLNVMTEGEIASAKKSLLENFSFPLFVKPANSGSSVGVTKVDDAGMLDDAIDDALKHDTKVVIEEGLVSPREIEVGILGNKQVLVSRPGELILAKDFYDYDDKYKNNEATVKIPADLSPEQEEEIKRLAIKIYQACDCRGFARLDFFVSGDKIFFNEINTLPGFTKYSMYPMLMTKMGLSYSELLTGIIELAY